ncbi:MAG: Cyclopropane-fatty-acyl-phospholipid synthase, partial [uncultured Actinomycetospora sp.]
WAQERRHGSRARSGRSSTARCRCGSGRGTAARPGRRRDRGCRSWSCARAGRCGGCCGSRARWAWRTPTCPATSTSTATSPRGWGRCGRSCAAARSRRAAPGPAS